MRLIGTIKRGLDFGRGGGEQYWGYLLWGGGGVNPTLYTTQVL